MQEEKRTGEFLSKHFRERNGSLNARTRTRTRTTHEYSGAFVNILPGGVAAGSQTRAPSGTGAEPSRVGGGTPAWRRRSGGGRAQLDSVLEDANASRGHRRLESRLNPQAGKPAPRVGPTFLSAGAGGVSPREAGPGVETRSETRREPPAGKAAVRARVRTTEKKWIFGLDCARRRVQRQHRENSRARPGRPVVPAELAGGR